MCFNIYKWLLCAHDGEYAVFDGGDRTQDSTFKIEDVLMSFSFKTLTKALSGCLMVAALCGACMAITGCSSRIEPDTSTLDDVRNNADFHDESIDIAGMDLVITEKDADASYDQTALSTITLSDSEVTTDALGVITEGTITTITIPGTYVVSGALSDGQLCVDVSNESDVQLILANCNITNQSGPAIFIRNANKVYFTLMDGTQNVFVDGSEYTLEHDLGDDMNDAKGAAICSTGDIAINGTGRLGAIGNFSNGIFTEGSLVVASGDIAVNANNDALHGCKNVKIAGGSLNLNAGRNAVMADHDGPTSGFVSITRGQININAQNNGICARSFANIADGFYTINAKHSALYSGVEGRMVTGQYDIASGGIAICFAKVMHIEGGEVRISESQIGYASEKILIDNGIVDVHATENAFVAYPSSMLIDAVDVQTSTDADAYSSDTTTDIAASLPSFDDMDANDDCLFHMTMGQVGAWSEEEVLLSAGSIVMNGGKFESGTTGDNLGMAYKKDARANGGTFFLTSMGDAVSDFNGGSALSSIAMLAGPADTTITLGSRSESNLVHYDSPIPFKVVLVASSFMQEGADYTIKAGAESTTAAPSV